MDNVWCYLCGEKYQPTEAATWTHVKHVDGRSYQATVEQLASWLEGCQFERDAALRTGGSPVDQEIVRIIADDRCPQSTCDCACDNPHGNKP